MIENISYGLLVGDKLPSSLRLSIYNDFGVLSPFSGLGVSGSGSIVL